MSEPATYFVLGFVLAVWVAVTVAMWLALTACRKANDWFRREWGKPALTLAQRSIVATFLILGLAEACVETLLDRTDHVFSLAAGGLFAWQAARILQARYRTRATPPNERGEDT